MSGSISSDRANGHRVTSENSVWSPACQQQAYRVLLEAMSYPGRVHQLPESVADTSAWLVVMATLADSSVSVADPEQQIDADTKQLLKTSFEKPHLADFILSKGGIAPNPDLRPRLGTVYQPEFGSTIVLSVDSLATSDLADASLGIVIRGPGVNGEQTTFVRGLDAEWIEQREQWVADFPMGVDLFLCGTHQVVGLPRTSNVAVLSR